MSTPHPAGRTAARSGQSNAGTLIALVGLLLMGAGLLGLTALVLPQTVAVVLVVGGLFIAPAMFHYVVWGRWLSQMKDDGPEEP